MNHGKAREPVVGSIHRSEVQVPLRGDLVTLMQSKGDVSSSPVKAGREQRRAIASVDMGEQLSPGGWLLVPISPALLGLGLEFAGEHNRRSFLSAVGYG